MSLIFFEKQKELKANFTSALKETVCLKGFHIFLYFKSGHYQIWNLITDQLVVSKILPNDILRFLIVNDTNLLYLTVNGIIKVYDIFKSTDVDFYSPSIPTNLGLNLNNFAIAPDIYKLNIINQCVLYVTQDQGLLYLVERATLSPHKVGHALSVFNPALSPQPIYQHIQEHNNLLQFTYLHKSARFLLWDQFFLDPPKTKDKDKKKAEHNAFFYLGEFTSERIAVSKIEIVNNINEENSLNSIVIGIGETNNPSRIVFFENTNVVPVIKVFDMQDMLILKQVSFTVSPDEYCVSNVYSLFTPSSARSQLFGILEIESDETKVNLYKFKRNFEPMLSQTIQRTDNSIFDVDRVNGRYCVEVEKGDNVGENPFRDMPINLRFFRSMRSKHLSLFFLMKLNVYHIYIIKMVMDFIPE